jgi:hypothetical protein
MNPKELKSTGYALIFSNGIQERSNLISPPIESGRYRQNRMVRLVKMGQEANA